MAYNYFPTGYPVYSTPYNGYQQNVQQPQMQQQTGSSIVWCQGIEGAKAYPVAAGSSVLLLDSESEMFFIKSVDASGMPLPLRIFDYKERVQNVQQAQPQSPAIDTKDFITREEFEERLAKLTQPAPKKER